MSQIGQSGGLGSVVFAGQLVGIREVDNHGWHGWLYGL
jgi:hypothetical protein